jgi:hypothetical protein
MTTLDNSIQQPSAPLAQEASNNDKKQKALEALRRLQAKQEDDPPYINKPKNIGDSLILWFDSEKHKPDTAPDNFTKPTPENPNPKRPVEVFKVKTKDGYWRRISLNSPGEAMEVFAKLANNTANGCAWIELKRVEGNRGGTRINFSVVGE